MKKYDWSNKWYYRGFSISGFENSGWGIGQDNHIVYIAKNKNNELTYVGATTKSVEERKVDHIQKSNKGTGSYFQEAIGTYGPEAFSWEQIDTANDINELAEKEKQYILKYNSKEEGYNSDTGGGFKKIVYQYDLFTGKLINKFDSLDIAAKEVNTTKQHLSRACLSVNKVFSGYFWSYQCKDPFKPEKDARKKEVFQFNPTGISVAHYVSVAEASRQTGISKTCISRCCRGEREQTGGFKWKYI